MLIKITTKEICKIYFPEIGGWSSIGLEFSSFAGEADANFSNDIICKIIDKEKFLWAQMKYGLDYEAYKPYKSFVRKTKSKA